MDKWADYGISAVKYNSEHTHIERVRIHPDKGDKIGESTEHSREAIIDAIKQGTTFVTIVKGSDGWRKGQPVYIIKVGGTEFIKTVDNGLESDNLENLPEF